MNIVHSNDIQALVLTGGPGGGKSSLIPSLESELRRHGSDVVIVPEAATYLKAKGVTPGKNGLTVLEFQRNVFEVIYFFEDRARTILLSSQALHRVMICDRGTMDGMAYVSPADFIHLGVSQGCSITHLRDSRYHNVFHLVTAAIGAEQYYTTDNNPARTETLEQARERDSLTSYAWIGHPHLRIIDNSTDFHDKKE